LKNIYFIDESFVLEKNSSKEKESVHDFGIKLFSLHTHWLKERFENGRFFRITNNQQRKWFGHHQ
jgi:hypothetical protein